MPKRKHPQKNLTPPYYLYAALLTVATCPLLIHFLFRQSPNTTLANDSCQRFFHNHTFKMAENNNPITTNLLGVIHGPGDQEASDCLESQIRDGDHLLIESPDNGEAVNCDAVDPAYAKFNGKLKCFGFDISIDEARRRYNDFAMKANFIKNYHQSFFINAKTTQDVINNIKRFANFLLESQQTPPQQNLDPELIPRTSKYFTKLANKLRGFQNAFEIQQFLTQENNLLVKKAEQYEELSRKGPTNHALTEQIKLHQKQLQGSGFRLFGVVGDRHLDPSLNKYLHEITSGPEPVTLFRTKRI